MLDLSALAAKRKAIVPVLSKSFVLDRKVFSIDCEDGWFLVEIENNSAKSLEPHYWVDIPKKILALGYTLNNNLIFYNGDVAKRKWNLPIQMPLQFNNVESLSSVKAIIWEDNKAYFVEPNYSDLLIYDVKTYVDQMRPLSELKGITPELRYLYVTYSLEQERLRVAQEAASHAERMQELPYRLQHMFGLAGAEILNLSQVGQRIVVDWRISGYHYTYNTVLNADTLMVIEAGYCLNGGDRRLNITSLVLTAKEFEDEGLTYITRG